MCLCSVRLLDTGKQSQSLRQPEHTNDDMLLVNQTTATAPLPGFMDMVLLVIESEKTGQDVVKLLDEFKPTFSTVLNKSPNYFPARLQQEFLTYV